MDSGGISVISIQDTTDVDETQVNRKRENRLPIKDVWKAIFVAVSKILAISLLGCIPWTSIPRTNSIFYQWHWWELLLPAAANRLWVAGHHILNLSTWFKEESLITFKIYLKIFIFSMTPMTISYISAYAIWTVYLDSNHPLPKLGWILWMINLATVPVGLWFVFPTRILAEKDFRQKLLMYTSQQLWVALMAASNQVLMIFWRIFPAGY